MIPRNVLPVAAAAVALAAGCGGGAAETSSRVTTATATTDQTTSTATTDHTDDLSGTTVTSVTSTNDMRVYLRRVNRVRRQLEIVRRSTTALDRAIQAHDGTAAGQAAREAATGVRRALVMAKRIHPREPLRSVHSELLANLHLGAAYLTRMANDIESQDMARIHRWPKTVVPNIRKAERSYAEWATNIAAFASMLEMRPPHWLHSCRSGALRPARA